MGHTVIDDSFRRLVDEFAPVNQIGSGFIFTEGPIWHPVDNYLLFSDMPGDVRRRWDENGVSEVAKPSNKGNGLTYDATLNLLVCEHSTSSVVRISPDGKREVLCSHFEEKELNSPNDIIVRSDGAIYFTDPTYGRLEHFGVPRPTQLGFQAVYRLPPGHRPGDEPELVSDRYIFTQPNGLCLSPCEKFMWVNDTDQANIRKFDIADNDSLTNGRTFASGIKDSSLAGVPDGMKADEEGNVWVTAPGGVWVYSFHGILLGKIEVPEMVANLHWGGEDWKTLFMCSCTSVYTLRTKIAPHTEPFMEPAGGSSTASETPEMDGKLNIDPKRSVLIIQDMQNDVIMEGGAFADSGSPLHAKQQNVVENARRLADACRNSGVLVIHVWLLCEPGHPAMSQNSPLM